MRLVDIPSMFINYLKENIDSEIATIIETLLEEQFLRMWTETHLKQNHLEMVSLIEVENSEESKGWLGEP